MKRFFDIELGVALMFLLLIFGCKMATMALPYYLDELGTYALPAHRLFVDGHLLHSLPGLHPPFFLLGHPPALYVTLTLLYRLFGEHAVVAHAFIVFVAFAGVYYTYLLGKHLHGRAAGIIAALLLFFSPLFFAQAGIVTCDLVITSLGVITVYYFLRGKYRTFLVSSIVLVLAKESAVALVFSIALYSCLIADGWKARFKQLAKHSPAIAVLALFFIVQKLATGMYFPNPYYLQHTFVQSDSYLESFRVTRAIRAQDVVAWIFVRQYRWLATAAVAAHLLARRGRALKKELLLFLSISVSFIIPFAFIFFQARYILPVLPYLFVAGAAAIVELFAWRRAYVAASALVLWAFVAGLHPNGPAENGETDMQYADILAMDRDACRYVAEYFPNEYVLTNSVLTLGMREPALEFVSRRITATDSTDDAYDILVFSENTISQDALSGVVAGDHLIAYKRFTRHAAVTTIYGPLQYAREQDKTDVLAQLTATGAKRADGGLLVDREANFELPVALTEKAELLRIALDSPAESELTLRYRTLEGDEHTERRKLSAGSNEVAVSIADDRARGRATLALGRVAGSYLIRALQVSDFVVELPPRKDKVEVQLDNNLDWVNEHALRPSVPLVLDSAAEGEWVFRGWAVDSAAGKPASGVSLIVDSRVELPAVYGLRRWDVVDYLHNPDDLASGFLARMKSSDLRKGKHRFTILIHSADGLRYYRSRGSWTIVRQ